MPGPIESYRGRVAQQECDHLGHMNIQFYVARISDATAALYDAIGLTPTYMRTHRRTLVTAHQDISYQQELRAGDLVVMRTGVLAAAGKKVSVLHRLSRVEDNATAMTARVLMVGFDLAQRRSIALDEDILARAAGLIVQETAP